MKKAVRLVFVCSAIIFSSPSLMGMNANSTNVSQQNDNMDAHFLPYTWSLQREKSATLNEFFERNSNLLATLQNNPDKVEKWVNYLSGNYIDLGEGGAFFQATTKGDGRCFDHANGRDRKGMADAIQAILNEPTDDQFQNVFRMIAPYLLLDYSEEVMPILDKPEASWYTPLSILLSNESLLTLFRLLRGETEDARTNLLFGNMPSSIQIMVSQYIDNLSTVQTTKEFLEACLTQHSRNQLNDTWFKENLPQQLQEIRQKDEQEYEFYWYIKYCIATNPKFESLVTKPNTNGKEDDSILCKMLRASTPEWHVNDQKTLAYASVDTINKKTEGERNHLQGGAPKDNSSQQQSQKTKEPRKLDVAELLQTIPSALQGQIIDWIDANEQIKNTQAQVNSLQINGITDDDLYWYLIRHVVDNKPSVKRRQDIADLILQRHFDTLRQASIAYINTFGAPSYTDPKTSQKFYHYANFRTSSDPETGIASGYIGASTYLSNLNEIVLDLNSGLVQFYNHGDDSTPPVLVVLEEQHYTRYIYVPRDKVSDVINRINENIRNQFKQQIDYATNNDLTNTHKNDICNKAQQTLNNLSNWGITSADQLYQSSLITSIAPSRTFYNGYSDGEIAYITDIVQKQSKQDISFEELQTLINNVLAEDRRSMPSQIISVIESNISKLRYLIGWAQMQNFNPAVVFGFNPYEKLKYYRETVDILLRFISDTSPNDAPVGDEWLKILREGNEIQQKCYALMRKDAFGLDEWIKLLRESPDWAKDYLLQNMYQDGQWTKCGDYVWRGVDKTDKLRRFMDVHNNRVYFYDPNDQFNPGEITQEQLDKTLDDIQNYQYVCNEEGAPVNIYYNEQGKAETDKFVFDKSIQKIYRLAAFIYTHNQCCNDPLETTDVIKVLEELNPKAQISPDQSLKQHNNLNSQNDDNVDLEKQYAADAKAALQETCDYVDFDHDIV